MSRPGRVSRPGPRWAGLLVSVRDAAEAAEAVAGGAAIVDVKEPACGPLGAASPAATGAVAAVVGRTVPWTVACGELAGGADAAGAHVAAVIAALPADAARPAAAKAGPAGLDLPGWRRAFARFAAALPGDVEAIAVAYADWYAAGTAEPAEIIAAAAAGGARTLLVDTFDKDAPGIAAPPLAGALPAWIARARAAGMAVAVAGRLGPADIEPVARLGPDVVAVRSAACRGGRLGRMERSLVAAAAASIVAGGGFAPAMGCYTRTPPSGPPVHPRARIP